MLTYTEQYFLDQLSWYPWEHRNQIQGRDRIGVYLLAFLPRGSKTAIPPKNLLLQEIVYIGETHGDTRNLQTRWKEFDHAARTGSGRHVGGKTFHELGLTLEGMFIAALPLPEEMGGIEGQLFVMLVERELLWHYYQHFRCRPKCNRE